MPVRPRKRVVGVDGCRAGWIAVSLNKDTIQGFLYTTFEELIEDFTHYRILIDIPMGLHPSRSLDGAARGMLPGRASSVFPVPTREAVYAESHEEASRLNERSCGKRLSRQTWNICSKIREVDAVVRHHSLDIYESHPELSFCLLKGTSCQHSKKTPEGQRERLKILSFCLPGTGAGYRRLLKQFPSSQVASDDILDAMVLLAVGKGSTRLLEDELGEDEAGVPIRMLLPDFS